MDGGVRSLCTRRWFGVLLAAVLLLTGSSCSDLFNPSFLSLFGQSDGGFSGIDPPSGNIPLLLSNEAQISDSVFRFLIQGQTVITPEVVDEVNKYNPGRTDAETETFLQNVLNDDPVDFEEWNLPPRVRVTVLVTTGSGFLLPLELLDGLQLVRGENEVGENGNITALPPDLMEGTNIGFILQCPVAAITIASVEVYIPVVIRQLQNALVGPPGNQNTVVQCQGNQPPRFKTLEEDIGFNSQGSTFDVLRNYDPRFFPPPLTNLVCGGVVIITITGDLTLPFQEIPTGCEPTINPPENGRAPAYFIDSEFDLLAAERIPGRYGISVSIRDQ